MRREFCLRKREKFRVLLCSWSRGLLIPESLVYLTGIAFTLCRLFTAGRVFDVGKHDKKKSRLSGNPQLSFKIKALQLKKKVVVSTRERTDRTGLRQGNHH